MPPNLYSVDQRKGSALPPHRTTGEGMKRENHSLSLRPTKRERPPAPQNDRRESKLEDHNLPLLSIHFIERPPAPQNDWRELKWEGGHKNKKKEAQHASFPFYLTDRRFCGAFDRRFVAPLTTRHAPPSPSSPPRFSRSYAPKFCAGAGRDILFPSFDSSP